MARSGAATASPPGSSSLVHDLQVHQVELEMQVEELRRTHLALEHARDAYQELYDFAPVGYLTLSRSGVIQNANLTAAGLLNVDRRALIGRPFAAFAGREADRWHRLLSKLVQDGEALNCDLLLERSDGSVFDGHVAFQRRIAGDEPPSVWVAITDVSELRRADEARERVRADVLVHKGDMRFRTIMDAIPGPVFLKDVESRWLFGNRALFEVVGKGEAASLGKTDREIFDDPAVADAVMENDRRIMESGVAEVVDETIPTPGGVRTFLSTKTPYRDAGGRIVGIIGTAQDITERKRMEGALREREARLRAYFATPAVGIAVTSPEKGWIEVNDRICEMLGYPREELSRMSWLELTHPDDVAPDVTQFNRVLAGEIERYALDKRFIRKDGSVVWTLLSLSCVRRPDRSVEYFIAILMDIGDRRAAERELQASREAMRVQQARLDLAATSGKLGLWDLDLVTRKAWRTLQHDRLFGYDELQPSWGPDEALRHVVPEDRHIFHRAFQEAFATGHFHCELRITPVGRQTRWIEADGQVFRDDSGHPVRMAGTVVDVTDRKEFEVALRASEKRLRNAQRITHVGDWELDIPTNTLTGSEEICRIFEIDPATFPASYEALLETIHPEDREAVHAVYARSLETRTPCEVTHRLLLPDGRIKFVQERCETLFDPEGHPLRSVGTVQDVTEVHALHAQLALASRLAAMGTLVAGVAHEINNPLAATLSDLELVLSEVQEIRDRLGGSGPVDLNAESRRLDGVVDELKIFARPDLSRERIRLADVVAKATHWLPASVRGAAAIRVEDGGPPEVVASFGQIQQVVVNLVTNAAGATRSGSPGTIVVRIGPGTPGMARLEVIDQGTGIAPEALERIFEPFFTTSDIGKGMGLGLAVCHSIVTSHGGTLTVESREGEGSTFRVELPAASTSTASPRTTR